MQKTIDAFGHILGELSYVKGIYDHPQMKLDGYDNQKWGELSNRMKPKTKNEAVCAATFVTQYKHVCSESARPNSMDKCRLVLREMQCTAQSIKRCIELFHKASEPRFQHGGGPDIRTIQLHYSEFSTHLPGAKAAMKIEDRLYGGLACPPELLEASMNTHDYSFPLSILAIDKRDVLGYITLLKEKNRLKIAAFGVDVDKVPEETGHVIATSLMHRAMTDHIGPNTNLITGEGLHLEETMSKRTLTRKR